MTVFAPKIDMPLKFLETAHPGAASKSRDYFSRKLNELYQQKGTFYKQDQYQFAGILQGSI